jgi:hypothetical protein
LVYIIYIFYGIVTRQIKKHYGGKKASGGTLAMGKK